MDNSANFESDRGAEAREVVTTETSSIALAEPAAFACELPSPAKPDARAVAGESLVKEYHTNIGTRRVLDGISFEVRAGEKLAVIGRNGSGKTTLVKLLGGVEQPTAGAIRRELFMSWPLGFSGGVEGAMTGAASARFIARLYGRDENDIIAFVDDFAELGRQLYIPIEAYSSGMRMRLQFALTLAINFECFLIDEVISVGDQRFQKKCHDSLFVQRSHCAMILVSHDIHVIREYCDRALVLKAGRGKVFEDLELALEIYATP
jgi:capsular polysaccharide transport system ATP-binding protein